MVRPQIDKAVREFIALYINSVELLEILLLLRAAPDKEWRADEVAKALTSTPDSTELRLRDLTRKELARVEEGEPKTFRYSPTSEEVDRSVDRVAEAYAKRRTTVIALIFSGPSEGVRGFADAFKLRED